MPFGNQRLLVELEGDGIFLDCGLSGSEPHCPSQVCLGNLRHVDHNWELGVAVHLCAIGVFQLQHVSGKLDDGDLFGIFIFRRDTLRPNLS